MTPPIIQIPLLEDIKGTERQLGTLILNRGAQRISLPLGSVDINARVIDRVSEVTIKQVFRNTFTEHLEAVYIFPLAAGSAISDFKMKVGDRVIRGVVQERAEARRQYQQAIDNGNRAALMEQERDDVFTVQVGNLPPGEEVTIEITYSERLPFYENGSCELRLPLVVAPRYTPGAKLNRNPVGDGIEADTDLGPDASRISPPRLAQGVDPQTALKLKVEILPEDGAEISDLACSQHASKASLQQGGITVSLARADERLDRDFVLRWRATSDTVKTSLITYSDKDGETYGLLSVMPPRRAGFLGAARDIVFVLDRSGSMQGVKMTSAVRACAILLNTLGPQDRFAIASFDNTVEWMPAQSAARFEEASTAGIESGERYLRTITARGGTEMDNALQHALAALRDRSVKEGRLPSLVVLTDGEVGNESMILQRIQREIGDARLFVVGIDTAVNSGLLKRLANLGGGTAAFVEPGIQLEEALASIGREIGAPVVTDLQLESLDLSVDRASLSPGRIPDIFAGRASVCFFKLTGKNGGKLRVKGKLANGKTFDEKVKAQKVEMPCIAQLWAKSHIVDLEDQFRINPAAKANLKQEIVNLSVKHSVLTKFTAFVVVDEAEIVNKTGDLLKVVQAVEMPAQWEMGRDSDAAVYGSARSAVPGSAGMRARGIMGHQSSSSGGAGGGGSTNVYRSMRKQEAAQDAYEADAGVSGWADFADASWGAAPQASPAGGWRQAPSPAASSWDVAGLQAQAQAPAQAPAPSSPQAPPPAPAQAAPSPSSGPAPAPPPAPPALKDAATHKKAKKQNIDQIFSSLSVASKPGRMEMSQEAPKSELNLAEPQEPRAKSLLQPAPTPAPAKAQVPVPPVPKPLDAVFGKLSNFAKSIAGKKQSAEIRSDVDSVRQVMADCLLNFENAFTQIENGARPDASTLESARLKLVQKLAPMQLGMELPCLQRFLRATAIELISSLKDSSVSLADLQSFWQTKKEVFSELKKELEDLLNGKEAAFWDCSI